MAFFGDGRDSQPQPAGIHGRALEFVSCCRSLLLRAEDEITLLDAICHQAVQSGLCLEACIATLEPEPALAFQVLASRGSCATISPSLAKVISGDATARESARAALFEGRAISFCPAPGNATTLAPAPADGSLVDNSIVALPITQRREPWGIMVLRFSRAQTADAEAVDLLYALALDLGFRLGALRRLKERAAIEQALRQSHASLEASLRAHAAALQARNRELDAISYSISHDLRGPLRTIDGFALILNTQHAARLDDSARSHLDRVRRAAQRMGKQIDQTLDLIYLARARVRPRPVNLSNLAAEILCDLARGEPERRIHARVAPDIVANADAKMMRILLHCLFQYAWENTRSIANATIEFGHSQTPDDEHFYFLRDNGIDFDWIREGEPPHLPASLIFKEMAGNAGLATVTEILERHGGRFWACSRAGEGASLCFTLGPGAEGAVGKQ